MSLNQITIRKIHYLSDAVLYPEAVAFVRDNRPPDNTQLHGLLAYSLDGGNLYEFLKKQQSREWSTKKQHYGPFYNQLQRVLEQLRNRIKGEFGLMPSGLSKAEEKDLLVEISNVVNREFVDHVVAEAFLVNSQSGARRARQKNR